jgi:hypothetical protein
LWQTADRSKPALRVVLIVWLGLSWTLSILVFCYRAIQLLTS